MIADGEEPQVPQSKEHRLLALGLIALASLLTFLALFAIWVDRQALDTDNWTDTSSALLENEAIRSEIATYLVDELYANVDVEGQLRSALPSGAEPLAGLAAGGLREFANRAARELLSRPRAQQAWAAANRRAHELLIKVVEGGGDIVSTQDGEVTLDLRMLLGETADRVGVGGRLQQRLPEDAAQIVILRSDELELAQDLVRLLRALPIVLILAALALFALAMRLARGWRREALRAIGVGFVVVGGAALVARSLAGNVVVDSLTTTEGVRPAAEAAWSISTSLLVEAATATIAYGAVLVAAAWVAGPTGAATTTRGALAPFLRDPRFAWGALAVVVLLLAIWGPTPATRSPIPMLGLIALLAIGLEALRRQTAREHPGATASAGTHVRAEAAALTARLQAWRGGLSREEVATTPDTSDDRLDQLERLARLHRAGGLDDAEFRREKQRLLGSEPDVEDGEEPTRPIA